MSSMSSIHELFHQVLLTSLTCLLIIAHVSLSQNCYPQGGCLSGYMDQTNGNMFGWACGEHCVGLPYYTDASCNCACIPQSSCAPTATPITAIPTHITSPPTTAAPTQPTTQPTTLPTPSLPPVTCFDRGECQTGYMDQTEGNGYDWECGKYCLGNAYYTDSSCNCACIEEPESCATSDTFNIVINDTINMIINNLDTLQDYAEAYIWDTEIACNDKALMQPLVTFSDHEGFGFYYFTLPTQYNAVVFATINPYTAVDSVLALFSREVYDESLVDSSEWYTNETLRYLYVDTDDITAGIAYKYAFALYTFTPFSNFNWWNDSWYHHYGLIDVQAFCYNSNEEKIRSCDTRENDTCYIDLSFEDYFYFESYSIKCDDELPNCIVRGFYIERGRADKSEFVTVYCPQEHCITCSVNCVGAFWCNQAHSMDIYGYSCSLLEVNIYGEASNTHFWAPNDGDLAINVYAYDVGVVDGLNVYATSFTKSIILDVESMSSVQDLNIDAQDIVGTLNVTCAGKCMQSRIICPDGEDVEDGTRCNIKCSDTADCACCDMSVFQSKGINGVNWLFECKDYANSCANGDASKLACSQDYVVTDELISTWLQNENGSWHYDNENCHFEQQRVIKNNVLVYDKAAIIGILGGSAVALILVVLGARYFYRSKREKKSLWITNGLVLLVSIGKYDKEPEDPDLDGYLNDLDGIQHDTQHMMDLFDAKLHYDVYPSNIDEEIKTHWTEQDLKEFLEEKAKHLNDNVSKNKDYDGLVVILSCHGIPGYIITSDYKKFSKLAIHRIFSAFYPATRNIPRVFLYDCCSGSDERGGFRDDDQVTDAGKTVTLQKTSPPVDVDKQFEQKDIDDGKDVGSWAAFEHNPDYRLAVIQAANPGFKSKLTLDTGSYVIHGFYQRAIGNLDRNNKLFIHEIFDDIQSELHRNGKQYPTYVWNENTRYIRFKECENVEMTMMTMTKRKTN